MTSHGNIIISPNVIKDIIKESIENIEGVDGINVPESKTSITNIFKAEEKKNNLEVEMSDEQCVIDISIVVVYGYKIKEVASKVQNIVKEKVEELTGVEVKEVNITVEKVVKKGEEIYV